jgi:hypothetical protein
LVLELWPFWVLHVHLLLQAWLLCFPLHLPSTLVLNQTLLYLWYLSVKLLYFCHHGSLSLVKTCSCVFCISCSLCFYSRRLAKPGSLLFVYDLVCLSVFHFFGLY